MLQTVQCSEETKNYIYLSLNMNTVYILNESEDNFRVGEEFFA